MAWFDHNGFRFWYETIGQGRPLVFGHGLTADTGQIKQLIAEIPGWQLILWDCRGHGRTEPDPTDSQLGFNHFADDLRALLDHLSIERAVIGGLSMGAGVAARFASDHPDRTDALILLRPAWTDQPHPPGLATIEHFGRVLAELGPARTLQWLESPDGLRQLTDPSAELLEGLRIQCAKPRAQQRSARLTVLPAEAPVSANEWKPRLAGIPSLIMYCQQDPLHPPETVKWWAGQLAQATLHELPLRNAANDGHRREVQTNLQEFLREV
jgi:pimeloyl-ACP methyl ester carboxylesterase